MRIVFRSEEKANCREGWSSIEERAKRRESILVELVGCEMKGSGTFTTGSERDLDSRGVEESIGEDEEGAVDSKVISNYDRVRGIGDLKSILR